MSFESSVGDGSVLALLAQDTFTSAQQACGDQDDLTRELSNLCRVLNQLQQELGSLSSFVNRANDERKQELDELAMGCEDTLKVMNTVLKKYNALGTEEKRRKKLWQKIQFGNGEQKDLAEIRTMLSAHSSAILMSLNLCSLESLGRVEARLGRVERQSASHGKQLGGLKKSLHWAAASMSASAGEGSVWTSRTNDDEDFWRSLRRDLVDEGYDSHVLQKHKKLITAYIEELGNRGVFDERQEREEAKYSHAPRHGLRKTESQVSLLDVPVLEDISASRVQADQPNPALMSPDESTGTDGMTAASATQGELKTSRAHESTPQPQNRPVLGQSSGDAHYQTDPSISSKSKTSQENIKLSTATSNEAKSKPAFATHIEEVMDEEFAYLTHSNSAFEDSTSQKLLVEPILDLYELEQQSPPGSEDDSSSDEEDDERHLISSSSSLESRQYPDSPRVPLPGSSSDGGQTKSNRVGLKPPLSVQVQEVLDDDFVEGAHPNVFNYKDQEGDAGTIPSKCATKESTKSASAELKPPEKKAPKFVRFADRAPSLPEQQITTVKWKPEDLRFIFFREFRDFDAYQELTESYQALFDEKEFASPSLEPLDAQYKRISSFVTHSPYTPPATLFDLQYYRIPASYFHKFWHPQRVPIYLHGNVFDGISFTNWMYNWTAYTFKDDSFQMSTIRRFGKSVSKLGSALTDIEHAHDSLKRKLPRDLYDQSGKLWEELENIINDIMSDAEDRLAKSRRKKRLEVEFVSRFFQEMICGDIYYYPIDNLLKQIEDWCKKTRFHPDFIMLWDLWTA